jgi:hypothetical protein
MRIEISTEYLRHLKSDLKKESEKQLNLYHKDRFAYMNEVFFDRTKELKSMQKTLHEIIDTNEDDPEIQIKAIVQLQSVTSELTNYYVQLPQLSTIAVNSFDSIPNNAATTTVTSGSGSRQNNNAIEYLEWCKNNNPNHPDNCDCNWAEYQC